MNLVRSLLDLFLLLVAASVLTCTSVTGFSPENALRYPSLRLHQPPPLLKPSVAPSLWASPPTSSSTVLLASTPGLDAKDSNRKDPKHRNRSRVWKSVAVTSGLLAAIPFVSHAIDLASVSGGAVEVATTTSRLIAGLKETGFYQAFSLVFLSEIGDKTFFIAGLLSMKTSKLVSFIGSMGALIAMTVLSVLIGQIFHAVPSGFLSEGIPLDDVAAVLAFAFFGFKILKEAVEMDPDASIMDEELEEAEEAVEGSETIKQVTAWGKIASTFALVFAAEFGDRSFLSTIALSAAQNPISVGLGAVVAHGVATGIAVSGGAYIAKYVSERAIAFIGGSLFLVFALTTALGIF